MDVGTATPVTWLEAGTDGAAAGPPETLADGGLESTTGAVGRCGLGVALRPLATDADAATVR